MADKPILFLDVDGPLNPWKAKATQRPDGYKTIRTRPQNTLWAHEKNPPLRVWLNESHGPSLLALPYELMWGTTWHDEANVWIGPHIGLPPLPVVEFPPAGYKKRLHWKTETLVTRAAGRPFVWVDDECTEADQAYFDRHDVSGRVYPVDPTRGLLPHDFATLAEMAVELS